MGVYKDFVIEGLELAQDNFDLGRNEFCALAADTFKGQFGFNNLMRAAVEQYDVIQLELNAHYDRLDNEYADKRAIMEFKSYGF